MRRPIPPASFLVGAVALILPIASILGAQEGGPRIGETASDFILPDTYGNDHSIAYYRGTYVVLEWLNYGCPSVKKHCNAGNMQRLHQTHGEKGVKWLAIVSSAPGKQGHCEAEEMNAVSAEQGSRAGAVLLDSSGEVGRGHRAQDTPNMMVINPARRSDLQRRHRRQARHQTLDPGGRPQAPFWCLGVFYQDCHRSRGSTGPLSHLSGSDHVACSSKGILVRSPWSGLPRQVIGPGGGE